MEEGLPSEGLSSEAVSASYERFCAGIHHAHGYDMEEDGDRLSLSFAPLFVESDRRSPEPCLRILFRRRGNRIILERFVVDAEDGPRTVDIGAAHDALQAWMDYTSD